MKTKNLTNDELKKLYGLTLRKLRRERGLSQEILGEKTGLHRTYISDVEHGERNLSLINIYKLCNALNVSLSNFFKMMEEE
jgi:transcriptional regulator with XRE-family HTH domain